MSKSTITKAALVLTLSTGFFSCSNTAEPIPSDTGKETAEVNRLQEALVKAVDTGKEAYIVYTSSNDEYLILSNEDYRLANAFAEMVVKEDNSPNRAPKGEGWKLGGKGRTKLDALTIAAHISEIIPSNRDFEIHVERHDDGSFSVYYRLV